MMIFAASVAAVTVAAPAHAGRELVKFPERYAEGVHYATVNRGGIREEIFGTPAAIEAAKDGQPLPSGTVITMEDYRGGKLHHHGRGELGSGARPFPEHRKGHRLGGVGHVCGLRDRRARRLRSVCS